MYYDDADALYLSILEAVLTLSILFAKRDVERKREKEESGQILKEDYPGSNHTEALQ